MPYANNEGVRIYYEVEGKGPPLVLMYPLLGNLDFWRQFGFVESLRNDYRLILIDTRGHGASDKPHDPQAYDLPILVGDVVAVLDDLNIEKAHYLGYSMGGFIGYGVARYAPERFHSLMIGDANLPWKRDPTRGTGVIEQFRLRQGMEAYLAAVKELAGAWWSPETEAMWRSNDLEALTAMFQPEEGMLSHGFEDVVPFLSLPCLVYVRDEANNPAIRQCIEEMPNGTYLSFPGVGHVDLGLRSDLVVPHLKKFLAGVGED